MVQSHNPPTPSPKTQSPAVILADSSIHWILKADALLRAWEMLAS